MHKINEPADVVVSNLNFIQSDHTGGLAINADQGLSMIGDTYDTYDTYSGSQKYSLYDKYDMDEMQKARKYMQLIEHENGSLVDGNDRLTKRGQLLVDKVKESIVLGKVVSHVSNGSIAFRRGSLTIAQTYKNMISVFPHTQTIEADEHSFLIVSPEHIDVAVKAMELVLNHWDNLNSLEVKLNEQLKAIR